MSTAAAASGTPPRGAPAAIALFLILAFSYFISALVRGATATLAPVFTAELGLTGGDLGLLGGAFFLGFATLQLPLGRALDRVGPKPVQLAFLAVAVLGSAAFALARDLVDLAGAWTLIGVGVSACLMAPLTAFRRTFDTVTPLRAWDWQTLSAYRGSFALLWGCCPVSHLWFLCRSEPAAGGQPNPPA